MPISTTTILVFLSSFLLTCLTLSLSVKQRVILWIAVVLLIFGGYSAMKEGYDIGFHDGFYTHALAEKNPTTQPTSQPAESLSETVKKPL